MNTLTKTYVLDRIGSEVTDAEADAMLEVLTMREITTEEQLKEVADDEFQKIIRWAVQVARLTEYSEEVKKIDGVADTDVFVPTDDDIAERPDIRPVFTATVYRSSRGGNPSDVRRDIDAAWLTYIGEGTSIEGPCYSWTVK